MRIIHVAITATLVPIVFVACAVAPIPSPPSPSASISTAQPPGTPPASPVPTDRFGMDETVPSPPPSRKPTAEEVWRRVDSAVISDFSSLSGVASASGYLYVLAEQCRVDGVATLLRTNDAVTWEPLPAITANCGYVRDFDASGNRFVAVGSGRRPAIWTSAGDSWSMIGQRSIFEPGADGGPTKNASTTIITSVARGPGGWLAIGNLDCGICMGAYGRYAAWRSDDGVTWERVRYHPEQPELYLLATGGTTYFAESRGLWRSTDGEFWTNAFELDPETSGVVGAAGDNAGYIAVSQTGLPGTDGAIEVRTSVDGITWNKAPDSQTFAGAEPRLVRRVDGLWVIAGQRTHVPIVWLSADGLTWRREVVTTQPDTYISDVGVVGGQLVAVGRIGAGPSTEIVGAAWVRALP